MGLAILIGFVVVIAILIAVSVISVIRRHWSAEPIRSDWGDEGLQDEDALVPVGPPRKPRPAATAALPLPEPEPDTIDARGREVLGGEADEDALAS